MSQQSLILDVVPHTPAKTPDTGRPATVQELIEAAFPGADLVDRVVTLKKNPTDHTKTDDLSSLLRVEGTQGCSHPIRLSGSLEVSDGTSGDIVHQWSSEQDESHGTIYVPCKTRRADKCPSCARLYQGDAFRMIVDGLRGGEFVSESVKEHPALFVTFTAPSFGVVHSQIKDKNNNILPCRPRRDGETCEHGNNLSCTARHNDGDSRIGCAICVECFEYDSAALWNHFAGKLWRQTRIDVDRALARILGKSVTAMRRTICRTQFVKIAEFQKRGLVHFQAAIRIDGPEGSKCMVTLEQLIEAVESAHHATVATIDGRVMTWGKQLDVKVVGTDIDREKLAGYFAKYATKGSDARGLLNSRIRDERQIERLPVSNHLRRFVAASWNLVKKHEELNTNRWAHQFGFGGHFLTKSRETQTKDGTTWQGWSTTFKVLRSRRSEHHAANQRASWQALSPKAQLVVETRWEFVGSGYATPKDAHIAALRNAPPDKPNEKAA